MADLPKKHELHILVVEAFRISGWNVLYLPELIDSSLRLKVYKDAISFTVRVYIWNVTHGGGSHRPSNEYRIQITGVRQFAQEPDERTLILGWWAPAKVFAGFDFKKHAAKLGASPSFQVAEEALRSAATNVFSPYDKGNGEIAIAFRPDFIGEYVAQLEQLHGFGATAESIDVLDTLSRKPEHIKDTDAVIKSWTSNGKSPYAQFDNGFEMRSFVTAF